MKNVKSYSINYNHYYTDMIKKRCQIREKNTLTECIKSVIKYIHLLECSFNHTFISININQAVECYCQRIDSDMEKHSCEETFNCLFFIYKESQHHITSWCLWANYYCVQVSQKTFIVNVMTQVIKWHIIHGLEGIFSPVFINALSDSEMEAIVSEPASAKRQREFLENRIEKLKKRHRILQDVIRSATLQ